MTTQTHLEVCMVMPPAGCGAHDLKLQVTRHARHGARLCHARLRAPTPVNATAAVCCSTTAATAATAAAGVRLLVLVRQVLLRPVANCVSAVCWLGVGVLLLLLLLVAAGCIAVAAAAVLMLLVG
jgi:hypothetical protein